MNAQGTAIAILAGAAMLLPPLVAVQRLDNARSSSAAAGALLGAAQRDAQEILDLRGMQERVAIRKRPEEHVIAQVNAALADVGIPTRKLQGVRPEADQALAHGPSGAAGSQYRRQSVSVGFQQMSVSELGQFLVRWRQAELVWTPSRIELFKSRGRDDEHYDVTLVISAVYIADA